MSNTVPADAAPMELEPSASSFSINMPLLTELDPCAGAFRGWGSQKAESGVWNLELGVSLEFGVWSLEFFPNVV
jgi:hypothetical protein